MSAEDLFNGDGFGVPDSVARALAEMAGKPVPEPAAAPTLLEAYEQEQRVAQMPVQQGEPDGVWLTYEDVDGVGQVRYVQAHRTELEALRVAVSGGVQAKFLVYGELLEDVL